MENEGGPELVRPQNTSMKPLYKPSSVAGPLALIVFAFASPNAPAQSTADHVGRLIRLARDSQNPEDYRKADEAAAKELARDPDSFDAQRYEAMALLGQHDAAAALALANKLNKRVPDDIGVWALLSQIYAAEGNYAEAERCAQWVLDLRRNHPLGFSTAAQLREVFGDYEGAADFYAEALRRTPQADTEERAWLMVQNARMLIRQKNFAAASSFLDQADKLFPQSLQVRQQKAELTRLTATSAENTQD